MTLDSNLTSRPVDTSVLAKRMLTVAGIGLVMISFFLISAGEPNPEWGQYWRLKPLVMVPLAGAMGGAFFYFMVNYLPHKHGWQKMIAVVLSVIVIIIGLWLGSVLGLNGTYWD